MKMSEWLVLVGVIAVPLFACSSSDSGGTGGYAGGTGGTAGAVVGGTGGGTGGTGVGGGTGGSGNVGNTGGTGTGGGTTMTECQAGGYTDPTCGACMESNCWQQCEACLTNADCANWLNCAMQCSDTACQDACTQQYPNGETPALDWFGNTGCIGTSCGTECGTGGGGICDSGLTTNDDTCDQCLGDNCCDAVKNCQADTACNDCLMSSTSNACGGNANYAALDTCWNDTCGTACGGGGGCGLTSGDPTCDACIEANCCDQGIACVQSADGDNDGDPDCLDVLYCIQGCATGDTACEDACATAQPDGAQLLNDFFGCLTQACSTDCG